jgi:hypothetical protein
LGRGICLSANNEPPPSAFFLALRSLGSAHIIVFPALDGPKKKKVCYSRTFRLLLIKHCEVSVQKAGEKDLGAQHNALERAHAQRMLRRVLSHQDFAEGR